MYSKELLEKFVRYSYLTISDDIKKRMKEYYNLVLKLEKENSDKEIFDIAQREFNVDILFYEGNVTVLKDICFKFFLDSYLEETIGPHFDDLLGLFKKGDILGFMRNIFPTFKMSLEEIEKYNTEKINIKKFASFDLYDFLCD